MQVSVLGCGWLGLPLAKSLVAAGFAVKGSVTSAEKLSVLTASGIVPYTLTLGPDSITGDIRDFLGGSQIAVINIPPKINEGSFVMKMQQLIPCFENADVQHVLFISSISVYGNNPGIVYETTPPMPSGESGRQLLEAERLLRDSTAFTATIVRFAGLVGKERHPVYHLAGRTGLENPNMPVNLIHLDDCIAIIHKIITRNAWGEILNAVAPFHPTRQEYYTQKAHELGLEAPVFGEGGGDSGKTVSSAKLMQLLQYGFTDRLL